MNRITQTSSRRTLFTVLALTLTASLLLWQGAALAGTSTGEDTDLGGLGGVVDDVTEEVGDVTEEVVQEINDGTAGNTLPADGDSQESTSGSGASAEGDNLGIDVAGQQVARVGGTQAQSDGDSSSSGATILSLLGHQILGTSSSHEGNGWDSSRFGTLGFTCGLTEGVLCLDLLYAQSWAEGDGSSSSSGSDTDAAYLCLAGDQTNPGETCSGPVALRVLDSHSRSSDDGAAQHSDGGRLCLGNENADGVL